MEDYIERRIITGLIVSTDFTRQIRQGWNAELLAAPTAKRLAKWCIDYFDKYDKAPGKDIQGIYDAHRRKGLSDEQADWISDILEGLSDEYDHETFNVGYLLDEAKEYFQAQHLRNLSAQIQSEVDAGNIVSAEELAVGYSPVFGGEHTAIDPFSPGTRQSIKAAFEERAKPLIKFPGALGRFWGAEFTRGAFLALMGVRKVGKSYWLMHIALRGVRNGCNVVVFQAGDMTENQQLRRLGIYLSKRSDEERYCGKLYYPKVDCMLNQIDDCDSPDREGEGIGVSDTEELREKTYDNLVGLYEEYPNHRTCRNCDKIVGAPWFAVRQPVQKLNWLDAYRAIRDFRNKFRPRFKLATFSNESLSVTHIKSLLHIWERNEGFVPDIIIIDYADLLAPCPDITRMDFRNRTNIIWQRLRSLTQEWHCLLLTATQAAATAFGKYRLSSLKSL